MKLKLSFLASTAFAMMLALAGILNGVNPARALSPLPVQPFAADAKGGISTTQLGQPIASNYTVTQALIGERTALPWIFSAPGFGMQLDKNVTDLTPVGTVWSNVDVGCDGSIDYLYKTCKTISPPVPGVPLDWYERTTAVEGTTEEYLKSTMPPFSWLLRHRADITQLCIDGGPTSVPVPNKLNTVYAAIPYSPNGSAYVANTKLGGDPTSVPSATCLDSPQSSESITTVYINPPPKGDRGTPCDTVTYACADAAIYGMWTENTVELPVGESTVPPIAVTKIKLNNGPEDATFQEHWDVEVTNSTVAEATLAAPLDEPVTLTKSIPVEQTKDLTISCLAQGESLVILKNVLWAIAPTRDTYLDDNAFTFVVRVVCGAPSLTLVDKEVVWIKANPDPVVIPTLGVPVPVMIDELKANHYTPIVRGQEWLVAEVAAGTVIAEWQPLSVTVDPAPSALVGSASTCGAGCITFQVDERHGQSDVHAQLNVQCVIPGLHSVVIKAIDAPVGIPETGAQCNDAIDENSLDTASVGHEDDDGDATHNEPVDDGDGGLVNDGCPAVDIAETGTQCDNAIDDGEDDPDDGKVNDGCPASAVGESKANDNAQRKVLPVWCGTTTDDGKDDGNGLYPRWTIFQSVGSTGLARAGDLRKPLKSSVAFPSDTGYVERILDLQCFWIDSDGCQKPGGASCDNDTSGYIDEVESWQDEELLALTEPNPAGGTRVGIAALDTDGDCLMDAALAQPGHPVDELDEPKTTGDPPAPVNCPAVPYSENPMSVVYNEATDQDCDGLPDGVEKAWGSNPQDPDSDGDEAPDFVEMFVFSNPLNPDTDGDGFLDKPSSAYAPNTDNAMDNCPGVYNPGQENNDGQPRPAGPTIGIASNPNADKIGDACDDDDDNDGAADTYESGLGGTSSTNVDSDGDRVNDNAEFLYGVAGSASNPAVKPSWSSTAQLYYRGCHINVPTQGARPPWNDEYDLTPDDVENDPDGDGLKCDVGLGDQDTDNGMYTYAGAKDEILDEFEAFGYNTSISGKDTDGDGCEDWVEICDLNGDRAVNSGDILLIALRIAKIAPFNDPQNPISETVFDVNKDKQVNSGDFLLMALNTCGFKPGIGGCPKCMAGN